MRPLSPWTVRRACRWTGLALAVLLLLVTVPTWWTVNQADPAVADGVCRGTRGCEQAYFCPSNTGTLLPHPALCVEGAFVTQEVDSAGWHDPLEAAWPGGLLPLESGTITVRWMSSSSHRAVSP